MARMNHWQLAVALGLALSLVAGCEQKGPAQKVGEKVDKAVDQTGKTIQDTAKEAEKKVKEATK
jgi:hypothetical protein